MRRPGNAACCRASGSPVLRFELVPCVQVKSDDDKLELEDKHKLERMVKVSLCTIICKWLYGYSSQSGCIIGFSFALKMRLFCLFSGFNIAHPLLVLCRSLVRR